MDPKDIVAVILSLVVLVFVLSGAAIRIFVDRSTPHAISPEEINAWGDLMNVIIGALSGYIFGAAQKNKGP